MFYIKIIVRMPVEICLLRMLMFIWPLVRFDLKAQAHKENNLSHIYVDCGKNFPPVFAIVIECVGESLAKKITNTVSIPTIGIGASKYCDGQILVTEDIIGLSDFRAKFVKQYFNAKKFIEKSIRNYCNDVTKGKFPSFQNVYKF